MADGYEFPVDRSAVMLFARSVLDINPAFCDPNDPTTIENGGIVTSPTFVQSSAHWEPNYSLDLTRPKTEAEKAELAERAKKAAESGGGAGGGGLGRGLHAEQHYEYHHPIHAGDTLTSTSKPGNRWEKQGRKGGKLMFSESITEYRNQDGVLCVTATSVGVQTERAVDQ